MQSTLCLQRRVPALGNRGNWLLLTNLEVKTVEDAWGVVEAYRKRWQVEEFFRLLKAGLGVERPEAAVSRLWAAVLLGLALFLWEVKREESPFKDLLLWLGSKLGISSERDGQGAVAPDAGFSNTSSWSIVRRRCILGRNPG